MSKFFMCGHRTHQPHPYTQSPKPPDTNHLILIRKLLIHGRLTLVNETYYSSFLGVTYGCVAPELCTLHATLSSALVAYASRSLLVLRRLKASETRLD